MLAHLMEEAMIEGRETDILSAPNAEASELNREGSLGEGNGIEAAISNFFQTIFHSEVYIFDDRVTMAREGPQKILKLRDEKHIFKQEQSVMMVKLFEARTS